MIYKFALLLKNSCIPFGLVALIRVVTLAVTARKYCLVTLQLRHHNWVLIFFFHIKKDPLLRVFFVCFLFFVLFCFVFLFVFF